MVNNCFGSFFRPFNAVTTEVWLYHFPLSEAGLKYKDSYTVENGISDGFVSDNISPLVARYLRVEGL